MRCAFPHPRQRRAPPGTCGLRWVSLPPLPAPQARARAAANGNGRGGGVRAHRPGATRRCAPSARPRPPPDRARARPRLPDGQSARPGAGAAGKRRYKSPGAIYAARAVWLCLCSAAGAVPGPNAAGALASGPGVRTEALSGGVGLRKGACDSPAELPSSQAVRGLGRAEPSQQPSSLAAVQNSLLLGRCGGEVVYLGAPFSYEPFSCAC